MTTQCSLLGKGKEYKQSESNRMGSASNADLARIEGIYFTTHLHTPGSKKRQWPRLFQGFTRKDFQNLVKSSVAAWTCTILLFINPILANFGTAVFFAAYVVILEEDFGGLAS